MRSCTYAESFGDCLQLRVKGSIAAATVPSTKYCEVTTACMYVCAVTKCIMWVMQTLSTSTIYCPLVDKVENNNCRQVWACQIWPPKMPLPWGNPGNLSLSGIIAVVTMSVNTCKVAECIIVLSVSSPYFVHHALRRNKTLPYCTLFTWFIIYSSNVTTFSSESYSHFTVSHH